MTIVLFIVLIAGTILLGLSFNNKRLPEWFCHKLGWHLAPKAQGFDGCSFKGVCPRCGKPVLQDSQGNWFSACSQG